MIRQGTMISGLTFRNLIPIRVKIDILTPAAMAVIHSLTGIIQKKKESPRIKIRIVKKTGMVNLLQ
jgi:hypothetical protein